MYKTQKTFSPLECGICDSRTCKYRTYSEKNYRNGFRIPVSDCERLKNRKAVRK